MKCRSTSLAGFLALVSVLGLLTSCAGPAPRDQFYRLPVPSVNPVERRLDGGINIALLRTDPVHEDRAMVFSEDPRGLRLEQYRYKHWIANTPDLVRTFMVRYLRRADVASWVAPADQGRNAAFELVGRLEQFERHSVQGEHTVVVRVELELLDREREPVGLHRDYVRTLTLDANTPLDMAHGLGEALGGVMAEFLDDLVRHAADH
ncbi:MAG: ABC-type transport auxiliary lipoprotein family protein [Gammaproteobacteria bacterium]